MPDYILLQDGTGQITLQDSSGQVLLQSDAGAPLEEYVGQKSGRPTSYYGTYRRRPQLGWHDDDGLSTVLDTGGSIQVVRPLDQWSLARASRYLYRSTAQDESFVEAPPEPDPYTPFLVRLPLRGLGRNPYLQHLDWDSVPAPAPEVDTWVPRLITRDLAVWLNARAAILGFGFPQDEDAPAPPGATSDYTVPHHHRWRMRRGR